MNISIILPIYNEEKGIEGAILSIIRQTKHFGNREIIAVNDGSTDSTGKILHHLSKKYALIKIVTHQSNKGYGAAFKSGILHAHYSWIFFTDADGQFDIQELQVFIPQTHEFDFIIGFRKKRADPMRRIFVSFVYNKLVRYLFGLPFKDIDCAFKLMKKSQLIKLHITSKSFFVSTELLVKAFRRKYKIKEIGVSHFPRRKGKSQVTPKRVVQTLFELKQMYLSL